MSKVAHDSGMTARSPLHSAEPDSGRAFVGNVALMRLMAGGLQLSMVELTGATKQEERLELWNQPHMRFFFATPQTFKNDVCQGEAPSGGISLPVLGWVAGSLKMSSGNDS